MSISLTTNSSYLTDTNEILPIANSTTMGRHTVETREVLTGIVEQSRQKIDFIKEVYDKFSSEKISLPPNSNVTLQNGLIEVASILNKENSIPIYRVNELSGPISKLLQKGSGELFIVATSHELSHRSVDKIYEIKEAREVIKQLIQDGVQPITIYAEGETSIIIPHPYIICADSIKKQQDEASDFISKLENKNITNIKVSYYDAIYEEGSYNPKKDKIGHSVGLDIRLKDGVVTVISFNSGFYHDCSDNNSVYNDTEITKNINQAIKNEEEKHGKKFLSAFLALSMGTEPYGADCGIHSLHFAETSQTHRQVMNVFHDKLAANDSKGIATLITNNLPLKFFEVAQDLRVIYSLIKEVFNGRESQWFVKQTETETDFMFLFISKFGIQRRYFNNFAIILEGIATSDEIEKVKCLASFIVDKIKDYESEDGTYTHFVNRVNTTANVKLAKMLDEIHSFIKSDKIYLLDSIEVERICTIIKKIYDMFYTNATSQCLERSQEIAKMYKDFDIIRDRYIYDAVIGVINSEYMQQVISQIKYYGEKEFFDEQSTMCKVEDILKEPKVQGIPEINDKLREKITSLKGDKDQIFFDDEIKDYIRSIHSDLSYVSSKFKKISEKTSDIQSLADQIERAYTLYNVLYFFYMDTKRILSDSIAGKGTKSLFTTYNKILSKSDISVIDMYNRLLYDVTNSAEGGVL